VLRGDTRDIGDADFTFSPYKTDIGKKPKTGSHLSPVSRHRENLLTIFWKGFAGASGYYAGARFFGLRPTGLLALNIVIASSVTFFLIHYLSYVSLQVEGKYVSDYIPFTQYLDIAIKSTSMEFRLRAAKVGSTGELGGLGYVIALLQIVGFATEGFAVFGYLVSIAHCEKCSRYLKKTGQQDRFTSNGEALIENIRGFASLLDNRQFDDAIRLHAQEMGVDASPGHHLRARLITRECSGCGINHLEFLASKLDGDDWKDISETAISIFVNAKIATADHS